MRPTLPVTALLLLTLGASGCRPQDPVYPTDVDLGDEGQPLPPTDLQLVYDDRLMQGTASDPDLSHLVPPPTPQADTPADTAPDAAIQAVVQQHAETLQQQDYDQLQELYVPELRQLAAAHARAQSLAETVLGQVGAESDLAQSLRRLRSDRPKSVRTTTAEGPQLVVAEILNDDGSVQTIRFTRIDGDWRFASRSAFGPEPGATLQAVRALQAKLQEAADGLAAGSMDDPAAWEHVQEALTGVLQPPPDAGTLEPDDGAEPPAADEPADSDGA